MKIYKVLKNKLNEFNIYESINSKIFYQKINNPLANLLILK